MGRKILFRLSNDIGKLMLLAAEIRELPEYRQLSPGTRGKLDLALEEMASNIIKYGFDAPGERVVEIEIFFGENRVVLTLSDDGHAFNPLALSPPAAAGIAQRRIGGVGIHLVRSLARSMEYRRKNGRNILTIDIDRE